MRENALNCKPGSHPLHDMDGNSTRTRERGREDRGIQLDRESLGPDPVTSYLAVNQLAGLDSARLGSVSVG